MDKRRQTEFVAVYWPHRAKDEIKKQAILRSIDGGYILEIGLPDKKLTALLPTDDETELREPDGLTTKGAIKLKLEAQGQPPQILEIHEGDLR